jgi:hypothetical protein
MGQFDEMNDAMECMVCEAMCPEAVDGTLSAAEQKAFDKHVAGCVSCAKELEEAHRGAAWMQMLKGYTPEPPAMLLQKILAETTGAVAARAEAQPFATPLIPQSARDEWGTQDVFMPPPVVARPSRWAGLSAKMSEMFSLQSMSFQPRLAMTAAMAFFSIALTLNMTGVRVKDMRVSMLRPSSLRRSVADASASATRSFQNLRVVYEFESRVNDLRNNGELGDRFSNDRQDPAGPFQGSQKDSAPSNNAPTNNAPENKPQNDNKKVPQGKSELLFPLKPSTVMEKGA